MAQVDRQIEALYQGPLNEFTAARTALAKTLTGEHAHRVRRLKKPSAVAWAINQVFWKARPIYDRVMEQGRALRAAQIAALKGRPADVRAASEAHRRAVGDAVHRAAQLASEAGFAPNAEPLARMFEAVSLAPAPPSEAGRFTQVVEPAGFEVFAGVTPVRRVTAASPSDREKVERRQAMVSPADRAAERRKAEQERQRRRQADADLRIATRTLARVRDRAQAARRALDRAEADVAAAERAVADAQARSAKPIS